MQENYNKVVVQKPWGYEYLAYDNDSVGLWILHIKAGHSTSMHCHPQKNTGLVLLDGKAKISFLNDTFDVSKYDKMMIRKGLFHKTSATTDCILLEIESPKDKEDLVRLEDNYGRENKDYENENFHTPKDSEKLWLEKNKSYNFYENKILVKEVNNINDIQDNFDLCIILDGGLLAGKDKKVLSCGDVVNKVTLDKLLKFNIEQNSIFMFISK